MYNYGGDSTQIDEPGRSGPVKFVVSDLSEDNYKDDEPMEIRRVRTARMPASVNPRNMVVGSSSEYSEFA